MWGSLRLAPIKSSGKRGPFNAYNNSHTLAYEHLMDEY